MSRTTDAAGAPLRFTRHRISIAVVLIAWAGASVAQTIDMRQIDDDMQALRLWRIPSALKVCKHGLTEKQAAAAIAVVVTGSKSTLKGAPDMGRALFEDDFAKDPKGACAYALPQPLLKHIRETAR